jgi:hypothetical protein
MRGRNPFRERRTVPGSDRRNDWIGVSSPSQFIGLTCELLRLGHPVRFRADGGSMLPTLRPGDLLTCEPVEVGQFRRGQILLYRHDRGITAHRVVRVETRPNGQVGLILRGDSLEAFDAPVDPSQVLGRVVAVSRAGRVIDLGSRRVVWTQALRRAVSRLRRISLRAGGAAGTDQPRGRARETFPEPPQSSGHAGSGVPGHRHRELPDGASE